MSRALAVAVAALAVLAGCPATGGTTGGDAPTDTVTPAPLPTTAPPAPPGVSAERVDPTTLAAAHADALATTSYTLRVERRVDGPNGSAVFEQVREVAAGGETYAGRYGYVNVTIDVPMARQSVAYWTGGDGYATVHSRLGRPVSYGWATSGEPIRDVDHSATLERVLGAVDLRVVDRSATAVVLAGRIGGPVSGLPRPPFVTGVRNATVTLRATHAGLVTDWRYGYEARFLERPVRVSYEGTVTEVGTTTVERPDWVDVARNRTSP